MLSGTMKQPTSNNPGPEELVAGLELALVQVDGQREDRVALVARVGVRQDGGVQLAQRERDVVEEPDAEVALCRPQKSCSVLKHRTITLAR